MPATVMGPVASSIGSQRGDRQVRPSLGATPRKPLAIRLLLRRIELLLYTAVVVLTATALPTGATHVGGHWLWDDYSFYPRVIRLAHSGATRDTLIVSTIGNQNNTYVGAIFASTDHGQTFYPIGAVSDDLGYTGISSQTLFELPSAVGDSPAGTLLWAASFGFLADPPKRRRSQRVWRSLDHGHTWSYLSTINTSPSLKDTWEPEFTVSTDGRLVVFYSDETDPAHSQKLVKARSADGLHWTDFSDVVAPAFFAIRPGKATVRVIPDGTYLMSYDICSTDGSYDCEVYVRHSPNGWDWGDPTILGDRVLAADGRYPTETPTITISGNTVLLSARRFWNADGTFAAGDGRTLLANSNSGHGSWYEVEAPIAIGDPGVGCDGYSASLLGSTDGKSVLQITTITDATDTCRAYVGAGIVAPVGGVSASEGNAFFVYNFRSHSQRHFFGRTSSGALRHWWNHPPTTFTYGSQQHMFYRGADGTLRHRFWDEADDVIHQDTWSSGIAGDPATMVIGDAQHVWSVDTIGALQHWWWAPDQGIQSDVWATGVTGQPTVMLVGGVQHAFVRTTGGAVSHVWWDEFSGFHQETVGVAIAGDPVATAVGDAQHFWAVDTFGNLRHWWWNAHQGWQNNTWATAAATRITGRPAVQLIDDEQHVFARDSSGILQHWWWTPGIGMQHDSWGRGVSIVSDPTFALIGDEQHLFGIDSDDNLHHWWCLPGSGLQHDNWGT